MDRTNKMSSVAKIAGQESLIVIRQTAWEILAPLIMADSSNEGSIERNAEVIIRNAIDE